MHFIYWRHCGFLTNQPEDDDPDGGDGFSAPLVVAANMFTVSDAFTGVHGTGTHFHSLDPNYDATLPPGQPTWIPGGFGEVGGFFGDEIPKAFSELSIATITASVESAVIRLRLVDLFRLGLTPNPTGKVGLYGQAALTDTITVSVYSGDGQQLLADYTPTVIGTVGTIDPVATAVDTWVEFDVKAELNAIIASSGTHFGIMLTAGDEDSGAIVFDKTKLVVNGADATEIFTPPAGVRTWLHAADASKGMATRTVDSTARLTDHSSAGDPRAMQPGRAYFFDSANTDYIYAPTRATSGTLTAISVCAFVKITNLATVRTIASEYGASGNRGWRMQVTAAEKLSVTLSSDGTTEETITGTVSISTTKWQFVGFTFDGTYLKIFVGDTEFGTTIAQGEEFEPTATQVFSTTERFAVGAYDTSGTPTELFDGYVHDLRVYDYVLSQTEMQRINIMSIRSTDFGPTDPLIHWTGEDGTNSPLQLADGTLDTLGEAATYRGPCPHDPIINAPCVTLDGINGQLSYGSTGISVTTMRLRVMQEIDDQQICTLQNSAATAITVVAGVLTFGGSLSASAISVDGETKTAAQAGVILNDNDWHVLEITLSAITASNLIFGTDGNSAFGQIRICDLQLNSTALNSPMCEAAGLTVYDTEGSLDGTVSGQTAGATWANTQTHFADAVARGCRVDTGVVVPMDQDGVLAANGAAGNVGIGTRPLGHSLDYTGGQTLSPYAQAIATPISLETADPEGSDDENSRKFVNVVGDYDHTFFIVSEAPTGDELTDLLAYVAANPAPPLPPPPAPPAGTLEFELVATKAQIDSWRSGLAIGLPAAAPVRPIGANANKLTQSNSDKIWATQGSEVFEANSSDELIFDHYSGSTEQHNLMSMQGTNAAIWDAGYLRPAIDLEIQFDVKFDTTIWSIADYQSASKNRWINFFELWQNVVGEIPVHIRLDQDGGTGPNLVRSWVRGHTSASYPGSGYTTITDTTVASITAGWHTVKIQFRGDYTGAAGGFYKLWWDGALKVNLTQEIGVNIEGDAVFNSMLPQIGNYRSSSNTFGSRIMFRNLKIYDFT